jgi:hypothetical protein
VIAQNFYTSPAGLGTMVGGLVLIIVGTIQGLRGQLPYQRAERERGNEGAGSPRPLGLSEYRPLGSGNRRTRTGCFPSAWVPPSVELQSPGLSTTSTDSSSAVSSWRSDYRAWCSALDPVPTLAEPSRQPIPLRWGVASATAFFLAAMATLIDALYGQHGSNAFRFVIPSLFLISGGLMTVEVVRRRL